MAKITKFMSEGTAITGGYTVAGGASTTGTVGFSGTTLVRDEWVEFSGSEAQVRASYLAVTGDKLARNAFPPGNTGVFGGRAQTAFYQHNLSGSINNFTPDPSWDE
jgi:hypothetical protein